MAAARHIGIDNDVRLLYTECAALTAWLASVAVGGKRVEEKRSMLLRIGAIVIAALAIVSGLTGMLIGGLVAVAGTALDVFARPGQDTLEIAGGYALIVAGLTVTLVGLLQVIFGIGLWRLSAWAWIAGIIIQSFTLITAVLGLFTGAAIPASLITIAISGAILAFLLTPHVRKAFGQTNRAMRHRVTTTDLATPYAQPTGSDPSRPLNRPAPRSPRPPD